MKSIKIISILSTSLLLLSLLGCSNKNELKCVREVNETMKIKDEMIVKFKDDKAYTLTIINAITFNKGEDQAADDMFKQAQLEAKDKQDQITGSKAIASKKSNKVELKIEIELEKANHDLISTIAFNPKNTKSQIKTEIEQSNYKCK